MDANCCTGYTVLESNRDEVSRGLADPAPPAAVFGIDDGAGQSPPRVEFAASPIALPRGPLS